ncbi:MAG: UvrD-helicase domain-containing protein, partial [Lachnospiraceae bacterium]|nr:UvrD-helicase domain-containing protein [Lachnospiraceae bacterium]
SKFAGFRDVLFSLYERALSYPFVKDWLTERKADYDIGEDFDSAAWVQEIFAYAVMDLAYCKELALQNVEDCKAAGGPSTYLPMMEADLVLVDELLACDSYTKLHEKIQVLDFMRLSTKKDESADPDFKELVKKHRDEFKKTLQNLQKDFFAFSVEDMREAAAENAVIIGELCDTLLAFHEDFLAVKKDKKLIDFSDMEHFALEILLKKEGDAYVPTKTALEYREYFHEIMIDEYQDSNLVQEWLLQCISKEDEGVYNRFMVGDVKQSIYQFRLARPQIFMEKFDTYEKEVRDEVKLQRIDLAKNYRSRREVVECVNYLFYRIMGRDLGNVAYDKDSALYLGASFADKEQGIPDTAELCLLEKEEDSDNAKEQEARMIALKIKELLKDYYVTDEHTGELRKASYRDIVILLRKTKEWDEVFKTVFESEGIPAYVTKSSGYFETGEIRVLLNFLKCLDNPKQDIALFGTMTSSLGGFTDEEMALVCSAKEASLWKKVQAKALLADDALAAKCKNFLAWYTGYREQIPYEPIHKILRSVIQEKGYLYEVASMPGGQQRLANVQMLLAKAESFEKSSYSGLFHFIRYIDKVQKYDIEFGEAGIMDEQDDVVRIMTIHKSKGLEFPICFVAGCAGRFNQMDAQKAIICDSNYGIGLDYVDIDNRVKYKDLRKRFLAKHIVEENLGEELRVLYVALTRAKEKLILTGICPSFEKLAQKIDGRRKDSVLCHLRSRISAKSYLDWIVEAMAHHPAFAEALEPYGYGTQTVEQDASDIAVSLYTPQMIEEKS